MSESCEFWKALLNKIGEVQNAFTKLEMVNSESDSDENSLEIFVAEAAEQAAVKADPVYEINGIRIWIQPQQSSVNHHFP
jgi:hypothetical protein